MPTCWRGSSDPSCKSVNYDQILDTTIKTVCAKLLPAVNKLNIPSPDSLKSNLQAQIEEKQTIIEQLPLLIKQKILDEETAQLRSYKLRTEISKLKTQIAQLPPVNLKAIASTVSIPQFWLDLSETERRFYFREFISKILIIPSSDNQFHHNKIQLIWGWI